MPRSKSCLRLTLHSSRVRQCSQIASPISTIEVSVAEDDVAKVIGRRGRTIKAIRTLARALAARLDTAVEVEVLG